MIVDEPEVPTGTEPVPTESTVTQSVKEVDMAVDAPEVSRGTEGDSIASVISHPEKEGKLPG